MVVLVDEEVVLASKCFDRACKRRKPLLLAPQIEFRITVRHDRRLTLAASGGGERMRAGRPLHWDVRCRINADRHSTIRSARNASAGGIVRPMALAALLLIANSNVVGCSTGRSPGFVPFKILST